VPVTIYDVAKKAGVGIGTVSRAMNDSPNINCKTKARIQAIAKELDYKPHSLAQGLARKKTFTIAAVVPFFTNYFFIELFKNIQATLTESGYDLILYNVDRKYLWEHTMDRVLTDRRADGVLIVSIGINEEYADKFINAKVPVVVIDNLSYKIDSVAVANRLAAKQATEHLIHLGHNRVGMINGHLSSYPALMRLQGYKQALIENELEFDDEILVICDAKVGEHGFNEAAGYKLMQRIIELGDRMPSALFVSSDVQALGVLRAAKENGISIPRDLALMGFDDIEFSRFMGLSTMRQPFGDMGRLGVKRLIELINGAEDAGYHKELKAELIVRETCGGLHSFQAANE
jgi:LacI family transcriptional regulator